MIKNLLTALMCFISLAVYADGTKVGEIYYLLDSSTGEASVTFGSEKYSGALIVPETITNSGTDYNVTAIGAFAFSDCTELTAVTLPNSITAIGWGAFSGCSNLKSVTLGEGVALIAPQAFDGCTALKTIKSLGDAVPSIYHASTVDGVSKSIANVFVAGASISKYKAAYVWKDFSNIKDVAESVNELALYDGSGYVKTVDGDLDDAASILTAAGANAFVFTSKEVASTDELPANVIAKDASGNYIAKEINITDGVAFYCPADIKADKVTYTRNFESTDYQALYLPYAISVSAFADKAKVAYINNVRQLDIDDDGEIDNTTLDFISKKSGSLKANIPYIIKANEAGEITFSEENVTLAETAADGWIDCMSTTHKFVLTGTLQEKDVYSTGQYILNGGYFASAANSDDKLPPFRMSLDITARSGEGIVQNAPKKVKIAVDGIEGTTDINGINAEKSNANYYDLQGRKVMNPTAAGVYVRNGKKVLVK